MAGRRLGAEERALWARVIGTVNPMAGMRASPLPSVLADTVPPKPKRATPQPTISRPAKAPPKPGANTLDGSWDRKLARGTAVPDVTVDLHGHTLDSAHRLLDASLERAIANGARILLLITGKAPASSPVGGPRRGAIRGAVGDWIAFSRHAGSIAAVRNAHPRHGGAGALYIVLKRPRSGS